MEINIQDTFHDFSLSSAYSTLHRLRVTSFMANLIGFILVCLPLLPWPQPFQSQDHLVSEKNDNLSLPPIYSF